VIRRFAAAAAVVAAGSVAVAQAATPAEGTVSNSSPKVEWAGTIAEGAVSYNAFNNNPDAPCAPPSCDSFALTVADAGANLTLLIELDGVGSDGTAADAGFRITHPDGSTSFSGGPSEPGKPYKLVIKKAPAGDYTVDSTNIFVGSPGDYKASAELVSATATTPPAGTPNQTTPTTPGPSSPAPSQPTQGTTMKITTRSASARKVARAKKLKVGLSASGGEVKNVKLTLRKGSKTLGRGKLATLASKGRVSIKLKGKRAKLKKGSYRLTATGTDSRGGKVSAAATLKVRK
jgi:hypothetical protein